MAIPTNKDDLLSSMRGTYHKLRVDLERVPAGESKSKDLRGHAKGEQISVSNQVAYLIGWGELVLKWHRVEAEGQVPDFPETGFSWVQLGLLAQKFYQDFQTLSYPELLGQLDQTFAQLISITESKTNEELYGSGWYKQHSRGRMIQLNSTSPYKNARTRIRKWLRERD